MKVEFHSGFTKNFNKRFGNNNKIKKKLFERSKLFQIDSTNSILKDHSLKGTKSEYRAFSVTGDIRVIYKISNEIAYFVDIGTHNQVY